MRGLALSLCALLVASALVSESQAARGFPDMQRWLGLGKKKSSPRDADGTPLNPAPFPLLNLCQHLTSPRLPPPLPFPGDLWALLIAGSAGWGNYRHQADVAHAYQVLHHGGIPDERIIVMVFDDIAQNPENPRPGTLINHPSGGDVYAGMPRDYTGSNVNAETFLAVLTGNASAIPAPNGHNVRSTGKIIAAGPTDRIFVFYSDHGAPGIVGMPSGEFLYADQLHKAIKGMAKARAFGEMVLYIEACESGSMFKGFLEDDIAVWASTAANERESSWGTYCPGMDPPPPPEYSTCLGDLYSVSWMEDSDANDLNAETLKKQYQRVRLRTSQNYTYVAQLLLLALVPPSHLPTTPFISFADTPRARM